MGARTQWKDIGVFRKVLRPQDQRFTDSTYSISDTKHYEVAGLPQGLAHGELAAGLVQANWHAIPQRHVRNAAQAVTTTWWVTAAGPPNFHTFRWDEHSVAGIEIDEGMLGKHRETIAKTRAKAKARSAAALTEANDKPNEAKKQEQTLDPWAQWKTKAPATLSLSSTVQAAKQQVLPPPHPDARVKQFEDRLDKVATQQRITGEKVQNIEADVSQLSQNMDTKFGEVLTALRGLREAQAEKRRKGEEKEDQPIKKKPIPVVNNSGSS